MRTFEDVVVYTTQVVKSFNHEISDIDSDFSTQDDAMIPHQRHLEQISQGLALFPVATTSVAHQPGQA